MPVNGFYMCSTKHRMTSCMENLADIPYGSQAYQKALNIGSACLNSQITFGQKRHTICHWGYMKRDM